MKYNKTFLIVLDGFGLNPNKEGNAVALAEKPYIDTLLSTYPTSTLVTFGREVGLPEGQMGNSEVGHTTIGSGRILRQSLLRISEDLSKEYLASNDNFQKFSAKIQKNSTIHVVGLLSDGGVHSHIDHLQKLLYLLATSVCKVVDCEIAIHAITDGRDTSPTSALGFINTLEEKIKELYQNENVICRIASLSGRYYAMDRDNRWERNEEACKAIFGEGNATDLSPQDYIKEHYDNNLADEFIKPVFFSAHPGCNSDDKIIFFNFRADRIRQLAVALCKTSFNKFTRKFKFKDSNALTFTEYSEDFPLPCLFPRETATNLLGEVIATANLKQLRAAETEKYPHVTYFFNGGIEESLPGEDRILVPSPRNVSTFDKQPEMSAYLLTAEVMRQIEEESYSFGLLNYANCDMVGHTGVLEATIKAVEAVDECLSKLVPFLLKLGWQIVIIADHGNAEQMLDYATKKPHTAHTLYPVPIVVISDKVKSIKAGGSLKDVAPTILQLIGLAASKEMTGESLILSE
jgi:2,3-bisphosphoglycerate-independent phosphoglycerate mutase